MVVIGRISSCAAIMQKTFYAAESAHQNHGTDFYSHPTYRQTEFGSPYMIWIIFECLTKKLARCL